MKHTQYTPANWPLHLPAGTTRTDHPHADHGFNLARHIACDRMIVEANRQAWLAGLELHGITPMWLSQTHSATTVDNHHYTYSIAADAAISRDPSWMPVVLTADCLPILLSNRAGDEVAAIHAGWQGLYRGIIGHTIAQMHSDAAALYAWIGPCISQANYEIDDTFRARFIDQDAACAAYFRAGRAGHWFADLAGIARRRLEQSGLNAQHIYHADICTYADDGCFSYRRDGALAGRMASFICPQASH